MRELKPNNARAIVHGERQVDGFRKELESMTGETWTSVVGVDRAASDDSSRVQEGPDFFSSMASSGVEV